MVTLSWSLVPTLIRTCRIQWWCSFFLFLIGNTLFGQIWSKKSKLSLWAEIWYLHLFEHAEFNGDVHFFVFDRKYPFLANLVQKVKIISWSSNLVARLIQICRIQWCCSLFQFLNGNTFFGQICSKNQNCHFKLKFGTYTNSNMQNLMVIFIFFVLDRK